MAAPAVTVVIATYNRSEVLREAIRTVLWQTRADWELIVVGDGCTDDSAEVVGSFSDPRVRWHELPENSGSQSAPNNAGIALARTEYVAYLGHDDVWFPDHLELLIGAMESSRGQVGATLCAAIGPEGSNRRGLAGLRPRGGRWDPAGHFSPPSSLAHRRDLLERIGGWRDARDTFEPVDVELLRRMRDAGAERIWVERLTVLKFTAGVRARSYRHGGAQEQQQAIRAIEEGAPEARERELVEQVRATKLEPAPLPIKRPPSDAPPGWWANQIREFKGLEPLSPRALDEPVPGPPPIPPVPD